MSRELLSYDAGTGVATYIDQSEDGKVLITNSQDVESILDSNKAKMSMGRDYYAKDPDMWKVASIPIVVQYEWATKYGITDVTAEEHWPKVRKLLNSSDWRYLKTAEVII
jgi:hypothetical protein